jgi:hypothetical protein
MEKEFKDQLVLKDLTTLHKRALSIAEVIDQALREYRNLREGLERFEAYKGQHDRTRREMESKLNAAKRLKRTYCVVMDEILGRCDWC